MRLLYIADGRSPIALSWMQHFVDAGEEVHLASLYPCRPDLELASVHLLPMALGGTAGQAAPAGSLSPAGRLVKGLATPRLRTALRHLLAPRFLPRTARRLHALAADLQPVLVHAMRIPYEGMVAASAGLDAPLLVSVWGNDFTLHAPRTAALGRLTRSTMARAQALHTDCARDLRLAAEWGFNPSRPSIVVPGGGGVRMDVFFPPAQAPSGPPVVINPRGLRAYVHSQAFFQAIPLVRERLPETRFLLPAMAGEPQAQRWAAAAGPQGTVQLLPRLSAPEMAAAFRQAQVAISPTSHDGTPNTLLEAMACGCFPVAGDLESLREWITPGENGLLVDPGDPRALADAILEALGDPELRSRARSRNLEIISRRAEYGQVMDRAATFYRQLL